MAANLQPTVDSALYTPNYGDINPDKKPFSLNAGNYFLSGGYGQNCPYEMKLCTYHHSDDTTYMISKLTIIHNGQLKAHNERGPEAHIDYLIDNYGNMYYTICESDSTRNYCTWRVVRLEPFQTTYKLPNMLIDFVKGFKTEHSGIVSNGNHHVPSISPKELHKLAKDCYNLCNQPMVKKMKSKVPSDPHDMHSLEKLSHQELIFLVEKCMNVMTGLLQ